MIRIIIISSLLAWPSFLTAFQGRIYSASGKSISVLGKGLHKLKVGGKLYFYAGVNQTGWGVVTQTFHTKAIAELKRGAAQKDFIVRDYLPVKPLASQKQIVAQIVKGGSHTCGLHEGQVFCWGWNEYGQTRVPPLKNPTQIASGWSGSCAIDETGVLCWGNNSDGQVTVPNELRFGKGKE